MRTIARNGAVDCRIRTADVSSCGVESDAEQARTSVIMEFSTLCNLGLPVPADTASLLSPVFDRLRPHPEVSGREVPGLLERLAQIPDPRDPQGVRHLS